MSFLLVFIFRDADSRLIGVELMGRVRDLSNKEC